MWIIFTLGCNIDLPETENADEPPLQYRSLATSHLDEHNYEMHPLHGALPPLPTDPSSAALDSPVCDEQASSVHPQHGMLPPRSDDTMCAQLDSSLKAEVSTNWIASESELGGQSQPNSMLTDSSNADSSMCSSQPNSCDATASFCVSSYRHYESVEVSKLEAKVKSLTVQLEEALSENKKKDVQIHKLQQLLEMKDGSTITHSYGSRPYKLKVNGSNNQVHTLVTPSGTYSQYHGRTYHSPDNISPQSLRKELREQPQGWGEGPANPTSNFVSRSKSDSPIASVSFV